MTKPTVHPPPKKRKQPTCKGPGCGRDLGAPPKRKGQPRHYCSPECDAEAKRIQNNARVQRWRDRKKQAANVDTGETAP